MTVVLSVAANDARLAGLLEFADAGVAASRIKFYATPQPSLGAAPGAGAIATVVLAKPCGVVGSHKLVLQQSNPAGDLIAANGEVLWGRWENGDGAIVVDGDASDESGTGFFKIEGTDGTALRAGGRLTLGNTEIV